MRTKKEIMLEAGRLITKDPLTDADRRAFDNLMTEVIELEERSLPRIPRGQPAATEDRDPDFMIGASRSIESPEKRAFGDFVRYGKTYREERDLGTVTGGAITAGAQFVPQAFYPVLTEAKKAWGRVVSILNERPTDNGAPMKLAYANDTGSLAHVLGEATPVAENDPPLSGAMQATDQFVTDIVKVSIPELQDSAFDIDAFVRDIFGKRYFRGLASAITNGTYLGSPAVAQNTQSIISGAYAGYTAASNTALTYHDIVGAYAALDPDYVENATWVMNSTTRAELMSITDTLGRPLFIPNPATGAFDKLLGCSVVLNQYMATVGPSNVPVQFGDFKQGYLLRTVKPGLAIARLNERYMDTLEVGFIGYFRAGGTITDAGTHPIVNLVCPA